MLTGGDKTTLAVDVACTGPVSNKTLSRCLHESDREPTSNFAKRGPRVQDAEIAFHGSPPMTISPRVHPPFCDDLWDILQIDVQEPDCINADFSEDMCLCRRSEEKENRRVRRKVILSYDKMCVLKGRRGKPLTRETCRNNHEKKERRVLRTWAS